MLLFYVHTDNEPERTSMYLENASISQNGSNVYIDCKFANDLEELSCVLVYREYGNTTLEVKVYQHNTSFPINAAIINPGRIYNFAIFGRHRNKCIDSVPLISRKVFDARETTVRPQPTDTMQPQPANGNQSY